MSSPNLRLTTTTTKIHLMALDGIVSVNSLFTLGLFLGLTWSPDPSFATTLITNPSCAASSAVVEDLVSFHVYSFSSFLFSSLIALALKQTIKAVDQKRGEHEFIGGTSIEGVTRGILGHVNLSALRAGTLVSGFGSVLGCGFLTMALVDLVQIKLGILGCGSLFTIAAIGPLVFLVPLALVFYVGLVLYAFTR